jgi:predicted transcriptional regulator
MEAEVPKPSDAELEILCILWDHQPASVRFVHEELCKKKQVGYTTTLKQMQRMQEKKMIRRVDNDDKTHEYEAILQRLCSIALSKQLSMDLVWTWCSMPSGEAPHPRKRSAH